MHPSVLITSAWQGSTQIISYVQNKDKVQDTEYEDINT